MRIFRKTGEVRNMNRQLFAKAITKFILGLVLIALLLFLPAGTIFFRNGWLFIGLLFIPMLIAGIFLMLRNPYLLEKRLNDIMYAEVLRENTYLSRTVEVQQGQKVIDTGLYGIVRHPMYTSTLFLFTSAGLVLGSPISFAVLLTYVPIIAMRIRSEEEFLAKELPGYESYRQKVKYRLIPFIW